MKSSVLYLVPDLIGLPGGIARYCRHVCRALEEMGESISVIALRDDRNASPRAEGLELDEYVPCARNKAQFGLHSIKTALRDRPRVVLCGHPNFAPLAYAVAGLLRAPWVAFLYGTDSWAPLPGARGWALRRADHFVAISAHTAKLAEHAGKLPRERMQILHNCLDPDFQFSQCDVAHERRPSILTVSRITTFEPHKGQETVLMAMPRLVEAFPNLVYDVVGDGDRRPSLERLATDLGVGGSVRFHGVVTDEMLANFYSTGSVYVMPSTVEGFGFVFAEAMAHGMPAIGGNTDAGPEVIIDGKTGFVVDPNSSDEVVDCVGRLLGDHDVWEQMSRAAVAHARDSFSYDRFRNRFASIMNDVMQNGDRRNA